MQWQGLPLPGTKTSESEARRVNSKKEISSIEGEGKPRQYIDSELLKSNAVAGLALAWYKN